MRWLMAIVLGCADGEAVDLTAPVLECEALDIEGVCPQSQCCEVSAIDGEVVGNCWRVVEGGTPQLCRTYDGVDCSDAAIDAQCECKPECCDIWTDTTDDDEIPDTCFDGQPTAW
jgi:hypothetical protein